MRAAGEAEAQPGIALAEETGRPIAGVRIVIQSRQVAACGAPASTAAAER